MGAVGSWWLWLVCVWLAACAPAAASRPAPAWLSHAPAVLVLPDFLSDEECEHYIAAGQNALVPSRTSGGLQPDIRSSEIHDFPESVVEEDKVLLGIVQRVAAVTKLPLAHFERLQLQRYFSQDVRKDLYTAHYDSIGPRPGTRRLATVVFYLTDVPEGGHTVFPLVWLNGTRHHTPSVPPARSLFAWACSPDSNALKIAPTKGQAVLFYTVRPDGSMDDWTVHGGCPVVQGTKWIGQQWISEAPRRSGYGGVG